MIVIEFSFSEHCNNIIYSIWSVDIFFDIFLLCLYVRLVDFLEDLISGVEVLSDISAGSEFFRESSSEWVVSVAFEKDIIFGWNGWVVGTDFQKTIAVVVDISILSVKDEIPVGIVGICLDFFTGCSRIGFKKMLMNNL